MFVEKSIFIVVIQIFALFIGIHMTPLVFAGILRARKAFDWFYFASIWALMWTIFLVIHLHIL